MPPHQRLKAKADEHAILRSKEPVDTARAQVAIVRET